MTDRLRLRFGGPSRPRAAWSAKPLDNSITTYTERGLFGRRRFTSKQGHGAPDPTFLDLGMGVAA